MARVGGRCAAALAVAVVLGTAGCAPSAGRPVLPVVGADGSQLFAAAGGPWTTPVPASAPVDPRSAEYVRQLGTVKPVVAVNGWTVPVYEADASTPRYPITAAGGGVRGGWTLPAVPIPDAAVPDPQDDAQLAVIDRSNQCVYEMRGAKVTGKRVGGASAGTPPTWTAWSVNATPADGDGVYPDGRSGRASGLSVAAGLIWPQELRAGTIGHALAFAYPFAKAGGPVPPATASGGRITDVPALPEGARLRLDPSLDLDTLTLSPEERTIAKALQEYGMVLVDSSGGFTLFAAAAQSFETFPYPAAWADDLWAGLGAIPFDKMQVLALPPQNPPYAGPPVRNRCTQDAVTARDPVVQEPTQAPTRDDDKED